MNWLEILRMAPTDVVASLNGNQILFVRGEREIVVLRLVGGSYQLEFSLLPFSNARQVLFQGAQHLLLILQDGHILVLQEV